MKYISNYFSLFEDYTPKRISIESANNTPEENKLKKEFEKVINKYYDEIPLKTNKILIDENQVTHHFPILTIGTKYAGENISEKQHYLMLSILIHENLYWWLDVKFYSKAIKDLKNKYPELKGNPIEVIVLWNEINIMKKVILNPDTLHVMYLQNGETENPKYRKFVLDNFMDIEAILFKNDLIWDKNLRDDFQKNINKE